MLKNRVRSFFFKNLFWHAHCYGMFVALVCVQRYLLRLDSIEG